MGCKVCKVAILCRSLSDFRLLKVLGEGQVAVVYHAEHRQSRTPVALKVYAKHMLSVVTRRQVDREISIQGRLAHTNIVKLVRIQRPLDF